MMSVVCAALKGKTAAISSDTLNHFGSLQASAKNLKNAGKLHAVNGSILGVVATLVTEPASRSACAIV